MGFEESAVRRSVMSSYRGPRRRVLNSPAIRMVHWKIMIALRGLRRCGIDHRAILMFCSGKNNINGDEKVGLRTDSGNRGRRCRKGSLRLRRIFTLLWNHALPALNVGWQVRQGIGGMYGRNQDNERESLCLRVRNSEV